MHKCALRQKERPKPLGICSKSCPNRKPAPLEASNASGGVHDGWTGGPLKPAFGLSGAAQQPLSLMPLPHTLQAKLSTRDRYFFAVAVSRIRTASARWPLLAIASAVFPWASLTSGSAPHRSKRSSIFPESKPRPVAASISAVCPLLLVALTGAPCSSNVLTASAVGIAFPSAASINAVLPFRSVALMLAPFCRR